MKRQPSIQPTTCELPTLYAVRALLIGQANADQQIAAMKWILVKACGIGEDSFALGGEDGRRLTDHYLGRWHVAHSIKRLETSEALAEIEARTKKPAPARKEAEK